MLRMDANMICEGCRQRSATTEVNDDPNLREQPYKVCAACADRLGRLALRPLEWFNLAAIHGPARSLLNHEVYSQNGTRWDRICEACRERLATEKIDSDDPDRPYSTCGECGERLLARSLRPLEWLNLIQVHPPEHSLLDRDVYLQDHFQNSVPWSRQVSVRPDLPEIEYLPANEMLAPSLDEAARTIPTLIDYCVTRRKLTATELEAFKAFGTAEILDAFQNGAYADRPRILAVCLCVCANVLGSSASAWVRTQYFRAFRDKFRVPSGVSWTEATDAWAEAAARCLPEPEGLQMVFDGLQGLTGDRLDGGITALKQFRSSRVLDWIEINAPSQHVLPVWGTLAALSDISWSRVQDWLTRGRPLSLIALSALRSFIYMPGEAGPFDAALKECPDRSVIPPAIEAYWATDSAPRVANDCKSIIANIEKLRIG
jgi:hypothetical protein